METHTIFFIGKPGCGKGDQARLLSEKTGWRILSSGERFRKMSAEETPAGRKIKSVNDAGLLQPHWIAVHFFLDDLFSLASDESVIFDGFGRGVSETRIDIEALKWIERPFTVIHLKVSDEEILHRLTLRKEIEGRIDDNVVDERLKEYRENTEPVVEIFRDEGALIEIDGERTRESIAEDILKALNIE